MTIHVGLLALVLIAQAGAASQAKDEVGCGVVSGACEIGSFVHALSAASLGECQQACQDNTECNFYTYHAVNEECFEFYDCHDFSSSLCSDACQSGYLECKCMRSGECKGELIGASFTDMDSCLEDCYHNANCNWWNHYSSDNLCVQLFNCSSIEQACTDCVHGEGACYTPGVESVDILLVTSGKSEENEFDPSVEVIPLSSPNTVCPAVPDIPYAERFGHAFVHKKQPVICALSSDKRCFIFNTVTWNWEDFVEINEMRYGAAGASLNEDYILIGGSPSPNTTEVFSSVDETWNFGPEVPGDVLYGCATGFEDDTVFLTGGVHDNNMYMYTAAALNANNGEWSALPNFTIARDIHACGIARAADGTSSLVIAGGWNGYLTSTTEILDLDSGATSWRQGAALPNGAIAQAYTVPYKNSFLIVGGETDGFVALPSIWQYDPDNPAMPWILRPEELFIERKEGPVAVILKGSDLNCTLTA